MGGSLCLYHARGCGYMWGGFLGLSRKQLVSTDRCSSGGGAGLLRLIIPLVSMHSCSYSIPLCHRRRFSWRNLLAGVHILRLFESRRRMHTYMSRSLSDFGVSDDIGIKTYLLMARLRNTDPYGPYEDNSQSSGQERKRRLIWCSLCSLLHLHFVIFSLFDSIAL
ncbi:hypothetical protein VTL71DRAFT_11905 [Oculimacula yallundae]|uniref:Uncharacterized protein n=1 Tax=Oculimacula yallundae TaxID=86028 RepID=A0ABR4CS12_9HELO